MARLNSEERTFRMRAGLCFRCGLFPRTQHDRCLCCDCAALERTKMLDKFLSKLDRMWNQCKTAA
jgi:hypothetical protein